MQMALTIGIFKLIQFSTGIEIAFVQKLVPWKLSVYNGVLSLNV